MPTGETIWVQVAVDSTITDSAWGKDKFLGKLEKLDETIRAVVRSVGSSVARHSPARTEIEFGIEIFGGTGHAIAVLANAHATAGVKVKMTWEKGQFPVAEDDETADGAEAAQRGEGSESTDESTQ
jgi:hypothetical protein